MRVDGDDATLGSMFGTFCSLFLLLFTVFFAGLKYKTLLQRSNVNILTAEKDLFFSSGDVFDYSDGLNIAVAFTSYTN